MSFSEKPSLAAVFARVSVWLGAGSLTCTIPKFTGPGVLAAASRNTLPFTVTVWLVSGELPRPLVPVPLLVSPMTAVPVFNPAVTVLALRLTVMLLLSVAVGPRRLIEPLLVVTPVRVPNTASSFYENPSLAAVF